MQELYDKLKNYSLDDVLELEETDRQFIALKNLEKNIENKELYLSLIILNSIICYQLSGTWEKYWEEFSDYFSHKKITKENIIFELGEFIKNSKNNKRFVDTKIKRLEKLRDFVNSFEWKSLFYYKNMIVLRDELAKIMKQKIDAKTIVFAVKMFGYWSRNIYDFEIYPLDLFIPLDSRLTNIFEKYKWEYSDINSFYLDLSKKLSIPMMHLDWLVWINYDELFK